MKFLESRPKTVIYSFLLYFLVMAEMSILSGYRFVSVSRYGNGLTIEKVNTIANLGKSLGWNYIVASFVIIFALFGYAVFLGFKRNTAGIITLAVMDFLPFIGFAVNYDFFYGYGTSHWLPVMSLFGIHTSSRTAQVVFIIVMVVITVACWLLGRVLRNNYAKKYEYD